MKKIRLKELFNIPNCLCYLRIILIPIFLHRYFLAGSKEDYYICATILIISSSCCSVSCLFEVVVSLPEFNLSTIN